MNGIEERSSQRACAPQPLTTSEAGSRAVQKGCIALGSALVSNCRQASASARTRPASPASPPPCSASLLSLSDDALSRRAEGGTYLPGERCAAGAAAGGRPGPRGVGGEGLWSAP